MQLIHHKFQTLYLNENTPRNEKKKRIKVVNVVYLDMSNSFKEYSKVVQIFWWRQIWTLMHLYYWCKDNCNRHTEYKNKDFVSFFFSGAEKTAFCDKKIQSAFTLGELSAIRWDLVYKKLIIFWLTELKYFNALFRLLLCTDWQYIKLNLREVTALLRRHNKKILIKYRLKPNINWKQEGFYIGPLAILTHYVGRSLTEWP